MEVINYEKEPEEKYLIETLKKDVLDRNKWINKCVKLLSSLNNGIVAIDGKWGSGKTFLAKQLQMLLDSRSNLSVTINNVSEFKNLDIVENKCCVLYYNVWENDNDEDPMTSFLYYILKILNKKYKISKFESIAKNLISNVLEVATKGYIKLSNEETKSNLENVLESVLTADFIKDKIKTFISDVVIEHKKVIIFIDELDRCRPSYALRFIECLNHYFKLDNLLVVCMVDSNQINSTIRKVYGDGCDSVLYLDKIFSYRLDIPNNNKINLEYINFKLGSNLNKSLYICEIILEIISDMQLSLRNIDRYLTYINTLLQTANKTTYFENSVDRLVNNFFIPYYIAIKLFDEDKMNKLKVNDISDLLAFCNKERVRNFLERIYSKSSDEEYKDCMDKVSNDLQDIIYCINLNTSYIKYNNYRHLVTSFDLLNILTNSIE